MFKTISAALIAVSVLAAPALAAGPGKIAPVVRADHVGSKVLNANARMMHRHHHKHFRPHPRHHHKFGALKTHAAPKFAVKRIAPHRG